MKTIKSILFVLSVIFLVGACKPETTQEGYMPSSSGKAGSILVVLDSAKYNSEVGEAIKRQLSKVYKGLPQPEPIFELSNIHPPAFKKIFQKHRNILMIDIGAKYTQRRILVREDVYAQPQIVLHVQAESDSGIIEAFSQQGTVVAQKFLKAERKRYIKGYKDMPNRGAMMRVKEKFGIDLLIPKGYSLDVDTTDFAWIESEGRHYFQGILVYKYPYVGDHTMTRGYLLKKRDDFTKKFVPGPSPQSYMVVEDQVIPFHEVETINGHEVVVMRGLWEVENDFMGGPFVSASIFKEDKKQVVTVDCFVYAPKFDKRNYVRQLEAILYTLDLPKEPK